MRPISRPLLEDGPKEQQLRFSMTGPQGSRRHVLGMADLPGCRPGEARLTCRTPACPLCPCASPGPRNMLHLLKCYQIVADGCCCSSARRARRVQHPGRGVLQVWAALPPLAPLPPAARCAAGSRCNSSRLLGWRVAGRRCWLRAAAGGRAAHWGSCKRCAGHDGQGEQLKCDDAAIVSSFGACRRRLALLCMTAAALARHGARCECIHVSTRLDSASSRSGTVTCR